MTHFVSGAELVGEYKKLYPDGQGISQATAFTYRDVNHSKIFVPKYQWSDNASLNSPPLIPGMARVQQHLDKSMINRIKVLDDLLHEFGHGQVEGRKFYPWFEFKEFGKAGNRFHKEKVDNKYSINLSDKGDIYLFGLDGFNIYFGNESQIGSIDDLEEAMAEWESNFVASRNGIDDLLPQGNWTSNSRRAIALEIIVDRLQINRLELMKAHHFSDGDKLIDLFSQRTNDPNLKLIKFLEILSLIIYAGSGGDFSNDPIPKIKEELDKLLNNKGNSSPLNSDRLVWKDLDASSAVV